MGVSDFKEASEPDPHTTIESTLPEHLRVPYHASGHTAKYAPDQFEDPVVKQSFARDTAIETETRKRKGELEEYEGKKKLDRKYATPVTPKATDDPALPNGVRAYLGTLAAKHGGDYNKAFADLQATMPELLRAHPRLNAERARKELDALFPEAVIPRPVSPAQRAHLERMRRLGQIDDEEPAAAPPGPAPLPITPRPPMDSGPVARPTLPTPMPQPIGAPSGARPMAAGPGAAAPPVDPLRAQAKQILEGAGYDASDASIDLFLSNPVNRQRLGGGAPPTGGPPTIRQLGGGR
jgi:hypothetical protein